MRRLRTRTRSRSRSRSRRPLSRRVRRRSQSRSRSRPRRSRSRRATRSRSRRLRGGRISISFDPYTVRDQQAYIDVGDERYMVYLCKQSWCNDVLAYYLAEEHRWIQVSPDDNVFIIVHGREKDIAIPDKLLESRWCTKNAERFNPACRNVKSLECAELREVYGSPFYD